LGERDILGYGGMLCIGLAVGVLLGFWEAVGVVGLLMLHLGLTTGGDGG